MPKLLKLSSIVPIIPVGMIFQKHATVFVTKV